MKEKDTGAEACPSAIKKRWRIPATRGIYGGQKLQTYGGYNQQNYSRWTNYSNPYP